MLHQIFLEEATIRYHKVRNSTDVQNNYVKFLKFSAFFDKLPVALKNLKIKQITYHPGDTIIFIITYQLNLKFLKHTGDLNSSIIKSFNFSAPK